MAKMHKFCLQNSIKSKLSRGAAPDPAGGLTAPPRPPAGFCFHESSWPDWLFFGGYGPGTANNIDYFVYCVHKLLCIRSVIQLTTVCVVQKFECGKTLNLTSKTLTN